MGNGHETETAMCGARTEDRAAASFNVCIALQSVSINSSTEIIGAPRSSYFYLRRQPKSMDCLVVVALALTV